MNDLTAIFTSVLNMSITASWVAVGVFVARLFLRKAPKRFSYVLWAAVFIRMVAPISFSAPFSLLGWMRGSNESDPGRLEYVPQAIGLMKEPHITTGIGLFDQSASAVLPRAIAYAGVNPLQLVLTVAGVIWLAGVAIFIAHGIYAYARTAARLRTATRLNVQQVEAEQLRDASRIYESDRIATPFVFGFLRPNVYIPVGVGGTELRHIIAHEATHIRRKDHWVKPIAYLAVIVHWFNPIVWLSYNGMNKDMEISCDERVLSRLGGGGGAAYSKSLLSLSEGGNIRFRGGPLAFGENHIAARIKRALRYSAPRKRTATLGLLVIALLIVGFTANPRAGRVDPSGAAGNSSVADGSGHAAYAEEQELLAHRTPYIGAASKVGSLLGLLPKPDGLTGNGMALQTDAPPYGLTIRYLTDGGSQETAGKDAATQTVFYRNAAMLFRLIDNVDRIRVSVAPAASGASQSSVEGTSVFSVTRGKMETLLGQSTDGSTDDKRSLAAFEETVVRLTATADGAAALAAPAMSASTTSGVLPPDEHGVYVLSSNRIEMKDGQFITVNLEMTKGKHYTEAETAPGGGVYPDNYEGVYRLRVINPVLSTVGSTASVYESLGADFFNEETLDFGGSFDLAWADYNGDGRPDFSLGQWAGGNFNAYVLYSIDDRGRIVKLDTGGPLYAADRSPSAAFEQTGKTSFATTAYNNATGNNVRREYQWDKGRFEVVRTTEKALSQS